MTMLYRDRVNTIAGAMILTSALLLVTACGGQSTAPAVDDATATAAAATIAAAFNTPPRSDDEVATAVAATLTAAAPPAITLPSPTPTAPLPPSATPADTATSTPPTATPVPAPAAPAAASLQTPDIQVSAPAAGFQVIEHSGGTLDRNEVWQSGSLYVLSYDLSIAERGQLIIEPGVIVKLARGVRIYVAGSLQVNGNADNGVIFTSLADDAFGGDTDNNADMVLPSPGDWNGLYFYDSSRDDKTTLTYARFRYAGDPILLSNAAPTLTNIQLERNNVNGYALSSGGWTTSRWSNVGNPYVVQNDISVDDMSTLTIEPGVVVKFWRSRLYVSGVLLAQGSTDAPITFTSLADDEIGGDTDNNADMALPSPGNWNGLYFYDSSRDDKTTLSYVRFRYAGDPILLNNAAPTLTNIQLEQNNVNGYALSSGAWTTSRWSNVGNPYVVQNDVSLDDMSALTIDPGVVIKFWRSRLYVSGVLLAQGGEGQPIVFTSLADDTIGGDTDNNADAVLPGPGDWNGLYFYNTNNSNKSVLGDAAVRYTQTAYTLADGAAPTIERVAVMP